VKNGTSTVVDKTKSVASNSQENNGEENHNGTQSQDGSSESETHEETNSTTTGDNSTDTNSGDGASNGTSKQLAGPVPKSSQLLTDGTTQGSSANAASLLKEH
jgi:hypothetical protein